MFHLNLVIEEFHPWLYLPTFGMYWREQGQRGWGCMSKFWRWSSGRRSCTDRFLIFGGCLRKQSWYEGADIKRKIFQHETWRVKDSKYICHINFNLPRTKAACIRSKVGTSMLPEMWLAASLILARPQVARSSSSGSLGDGAIIPRSSTRPEIKQSI